MLPARGGQARRRGGGAGRTERVLWDEERWLVLGPVPHAHLRTARVSGRSHMDGKGGTAYLRRRGERDQERREHQASRQARPRRRHGDGAKADTLARPNRRTSLFSLGPLHSRIARDARLSGKDAIVTQAMRAALIAAALLPLLLVSARRPAREARTPLELFRGLLLVCVCGRRVDPKTRTQQSVPCVRVCTRPH